jgi:tryptophan synthase alpha chain
MSRLSEIFQKNKKCFIPFVTAGYPSIETTREIALSLAAHGADIIELGIPFSDPIADGPVIQRSSFDALKHGYSIDDYLGLVRDVRRKTDVGLIFMSYMNPLYAYGLTRLDERAADAGLDGILISDLTPEAYDRMGVPLKLDTIFLAAPTSSEARLEKICQSSRGFVYVVARTGVTGRQTDIQELVPETVRRIRKHTNLPVAVGFGISSPADARKVWEHADGAIVGSALVRLIQEFANERELTKRVAEFAAGFAQR